MSSGEHSTSNWTQFNLRKSNYFNLLLHQAQLENLAVSCSLPEKNITLNHRARDHTAFQSMYLWLGAMSQCRLDHLETSGTSYIRGVLSKTCKSMTGLIHLIQFKMDEPSGLFEHSPAN